MKQIFLPALVFAALFAACSSGPDAEETTKREEFKRDSMAQVEKQVKEKLDKRLKEMQDSISALAELTNEKMEEQVKQVKDQMDKKRKKEKKEADRTKAEQEEK